MSDVSTRYATVAAGFSQRLEAVPPDRWDAQSPCEDWTARDVAEHVINTHRRVLSRLDDSQARPLSDEEMSSAFHEASGKVQAALADPEKAGCMVGGRFGGMTFEQLVGTALCSDTLIHTWDLARATDQDDRLDPEAVDAAAQFLGGAGDSIRVQGGFGPAIKPPPDADAQTKLLCVAGRRA